MRLYTSIVCLEAPAPVDKRKVFRRKEKFRKARGLSRTSWSAA